MRYMARSFPGAAGQRKSSRSSRKRSTLSAIFPSATFFLDLRWCTMEKMRRPKELEQAVQSSRESSVYRSMLAYVYAQTGRIEESRKILGDVIQEAESDRASWMDVAGIYAALGEQDHAFAALEMAFQRRDSRMTMLLNHEALIPLHGDPRFFDLLRRVGLPQHN